MIFSKFLYGVLLAAVIAGPGVTFAMDRSLTILAPELPGSSEAPGVGRDAELVSATLGACGHEVTFVIQPFGRHMLSFQQSHFADAVMTVPLSRDLPGYPTSAYIWYQNGAYYNADRVPEINSVDDLKGLNVITFYDGIRTLGLASLQGELGEVHENSNQEIHSDLLFLGRVDVVLADGLIVAEVSNRIRTSGKLPEKALSDGEYRFAPIFDPAPHKMVFREDALARDFDRCFDRLYQDGTVTQILDKYLAPHQHELRHRYVAQ